MRMSSSIIAGAFSLALLAAGLASGANAVDTPTTRDAPDLTTVRAKIKAKEFKSAIADLYGMIDKGVQHADVYNLLGFSLPRAATSRRPTPSTRRRSTSTPSTRAPSSIWASSTSRPES